MCYSIWDLISKSKLKLKSMNRFGILTITPLKIERVLPIHMSNVLMMLGLGIEGKTLAGVWKYSRCPSGNHLESNLTSIKICRLIPTNACNLLISKTKLKLESGNQLVAKWPFWILTSLKINSLLPIDTNDSLLKFRVYIQSQTLGKFQKQKKFSTSAGPPFWKFKINRLLPIHTSNVLTKFGVDIQSWIKVRFQKPMDPIWLPDRHFEGDFIKDHQASFYGNSKHAQEIWNPNS